MSILKKNDWRPIFEENMQALFSIDRLQYTYTKQVHGSNIHLAKEAKVWDSTDGLFTQLPHLVLSVYTADCVPVVALCPNTQRWGIVHAGWKGILQGIVPKLITSLLGDSPPRTPIFLDILPHICDQCYKVTEEFKEIFPSSSLINKTESLYLSMKQEIYRQLEEGKWNWQFLPQTDSKTRFSDICNYEQSGLPSLRGKRLGQIVSFCFL